MNHQDIAQQIEEAKVQVARNAISTPYVHHEWQRLRNAIIAADLAKQELYRARKAWDSLIAPAGKEWLKLAPDPRKP